MGLFVNYFLEAYMSVTRLFTLLALFLAGFMSIVNAQNKTLRIPYEKYTLPNGLEVILHEDKSDPIVGVAIQFHVGSNREEAGKTGYAHLFEHMLFQESEHVGQDQFFKKIQSAGGTLNGGTWADGTVYYEVVPKNALEMVLWMESDRMGWLLPTVTQEALANQKEVVQNEKRQRVDNRPYGHTDYVIGKLLYPEGHPYNWQVIGSLEDLKKASQQDIHNFYKKWYGPNNATLVVAGDYDKETVKKWIAKYFGEIPRGRDVTDPKPMPVSLSETKRAFHEDNFARSPELNMVFPTVEQFHKDSYALDILSELLAGGKKAPLYKVIVEEKKLAPSVSAYERSQELAGMFRIRVRAFPDKNLTDVEKAIYEAFDRFEKEGFTEKDLARVKAGLETNFYNSIASILGKSFQLAQYNEYAGSPDFITKDIQNTLNVTSDDVWRVFKTYIKNKPCVLTSFVPKGHPELAAQNSERFPVVEEKITEEASTEKQETAANIEIPEIPSSFDRTVEPPKGPAPALNLPKVWHHTLKNGLRIYGIEQDELPLVTFSLTLKGGLLLDDPEKVGVANLITDMMMEGTKNKTPQELEEAIEELGASINMVTSREAITINANTLSHKVKDTWKLFDEILLEPRWDAKEFERVKARTLEGINRQEANPSVIANNVFNRLLYGPDHILGYTVSGTRESVEKITLDDLKAYYKKNFSPSVAYLTVAGNISREEAIALFDELEEQWPAHKVDFPSYTTPEAPDKAQLYFVDVPNAKQSQLRVGNLSLAYTDPDFYPAYVMNYKLGGSFNSVLNMILREEKGYTYGAFSFFSGSYYPGPFAVSTGVRSNATFESMQIIKDELNRYREGISAEEMAFTKNALIQSNARRFETLRALLGMLGNIAKYELPFDYVRQQEQIVRDMTVAKHKELARKYIIPSKMIYLVVGDAQTQAAHLKDLGLGAPVMLDKQGHIMPADQSEKTE